jgi:hypothetical protein
MKSISEFPLRVGSLQPKAVCASTAYGWIPAFAGMFISLWLTLDDESEFSEE